MSWVKVDDQFDDHPKFMDLSDAAVALWLRALAYESRFGVATIPEGFVMRARAHAAADELVRREVWRREGSGFAIVERAAPRATWDKSAYGTVYERDGMACRYCRSTDDLSIDHVVPRCQGGTDESDNLVVACRRCNSRKGGRTPEQAGMELS